MYFRYPQIDPVLKDQHLYPLSKKYAYKHQIYFKMFKPTVIKQIFHSKNTWKPTNFLKLNSNKMEPVVVAPEAELQKLSEC